MDSVLIQAIHRVGVRKVAEVLQVSRAGAMALALGVATEGTKALAAPNKAKVAALLAA